MLCKHLNTFHPFLFLPSIFPSIRLFSSELALCIRWPNCWSYSFSISPSNEYSGWISFGIDWFDLLAVQGTLKSLLQHHSLKASAFSLWSNSHVHTGLLEKTIALTIWTFVSKVMSLLFIMLSRLVIAFLPKSKYLWPLLFLSGKNAVPKDVCSWTRWSNRNWIYPTTWFLKWATD